MEKFVLYKNNKEIAHFKTEHNRRDEDFLDEFYAIMLPFVPDAGNENLKDKSWYNLDEDLSFNINGNYYYVEHQATVSD